MKKGLTPRQNAFAKHVAAGNNATKSAILAGYSRRSARFTASKLLTNGNILQRIEQIFDQAGLSDEALVTRLKLAIDSGLGQKANNSDALKGLKMAFELKNRFPTAQLRAELTQEDEQMMKLKTMSEGELKAYLKEVKAKTREYQMRLLERHEKKSNGDDKQLTSKLTPSPVPMPEVVKEVVPDNRIRQAVGVPVETRPAIQPLRKMVIGSETSEDNHYRQKISYPA